jgi:hypothetical protein
MDALVTIEKPKRLSHAKRLKRHIEYLDKDVVALERHVGTLLNHLERAIAAVVTDQERDRYRSMINEIRGALAEGEASPDTTPRIAA